jgi:endonuclease/exonuclease/phosphatase family metal-dependent hydrolase
VPYLRIDHVLLSPSVSLESYALGDGQGSDHHPLLVYLGVQGR